MRPPRRASARSLASCSGRPPTLKLNPGTQWSWHRVGPRIARPNFSGPPEQMVQREIKPLATQISGEDVVGKRHWQRIGVVLSLIWCVAWGANFWTNRAGEIRALSQENFEPCDSQSPDASGGMVPICHTAWETQRLQRFAQLEHDWLTVLTFCGMTLAFGWLSAWGIIGTVRWVARGFLSAPLSAILLPPRAAPPASPGS